MIDVIVRLLKENKDVHAFRVVKNTKKSIELFYVTNQLETNRARNTEQYAVTVYHDFAEYRGSSDFTVTASFSEEDVKNKISAACKRAVFVKNKYYDLPKPTDKEVGVVVNPILDSDFKEIACNCANAIFKANTYQEGWINSCEIFVSEETKTVVNSNGIHLSSKQGNLYIELIPTWKGEEEEVELYQVISTSQIDYDAITKKVDETLLNAKARANAKKLPADLKNCNVIFNAEEAAMIFDFFKDQLDYQVVYQHMNLFNPGDPVCTGEDCDPIDITLKAYVEGSNNAFAFDNDGVLLQDVHMIDNNVCKTLHGNHRFGQYLNQENPTGSYTNMEVKPGSMSFADMKKEPYILCVYFSAPQVDGYSGYYGGEVRLGFYFDGKEVTPVTGFSVSGNLHEDKNHFRFSKEVDTAGSYRGPKYLYIRNMSIN